VSDELVARIEALRARLDRTVAVGISGVGCAGKSTLAARLAGELEQHGVETLVVAGDEFTRPTAERYTDADLGRGYYRDSFDYRAVFEELLPSARAGQPELTLRVTDWERGGWQSETFRLPAHGALIVEGCFLFAGGGHGSFDLSIWLELPLEHVVERALRRPRDLELMGGPDGVRARYARRYVPGQRLHLELDEPARGADVVLEA
jgi:uridine kinase